ncbi:MAG: head GIN domain-containing protein [Chitinophagaceae bacterium]|nr:head GIN domain-containing protein [Chitinophagaceae bacterium]
MKKLFLALLSLTMIAAHAQDEKIINDKNAQKRSVSAFHAIKVSSGIDLYLTQSNTESVAVSASDKDYVERIVTVVENGVLKIYYDSENKLWSWNWGSRRLRAYVSVKNIDGLSASGGSDVVVNGMIKTGKLTLDISGGSDFKGKIDADDLLVDQSGGSDIDISGKSVNLKIGCSGGSDFKGYDMMADNCMIDASGGSDVSVTVTKTLSAEASGGSDISYKGGAMLKEKKTSGGGSVAKRN